MEMSREEDRSLRTRLDVEREALSVSQSLKKSYESAKLNIVSEFNKVYGEYSQGEKLTLKEIKKDLGKDEKRAFLKDVEEMVKFSKTTKNASYKARLHRLYNRAKISRLEALEENINFEIEKIANQSKFLFDKKAKKIYNETILKTMFNIETAIGFETAFTKPNYKMVEASVNRKWLGDNFEGRLTSNKERLTHKLSQKMTQGIVLGKSSKDIAKDIDKLIKNGTSNSARLVHTEFANIAGIATFDGYTKSKAVKRFKYLATLDEKTSDICQELDGQIFYLSEKMDGVNYPPMHPWCRSTTTPYFEPDEIDAMFEKTQRVAREQDGYTRVYFDKDVTYKEWEKIRGF